MAGRALGALDLLNAGSEQQGIQLGADQDNFVKVVAINKAGVPSIEFYSEIGGIRGDQRHCRAIPSPAA